MTDLEFDPDFDPSCPVCWGTYYGGHICREVDLDHVRRYQELLASPSTEEATT